MLGSASASPADAAWAEAGATVPASGRVCPKSGTPAATEAGLARWSAKSRLDIPAYVERTPKDHGMATCCVDASTVVEMLNMVTDRHVVPHERTYDGKAVLPVSGLNSRLE